MFNIKHSPLTDSILAFCAVLTVVFISVTLLYHQSGKLLEEEFEEWAEGTSRVVTKFVDAQTVRQVEKNGSLNDAQIRSTHQMMMRFISGEEYLHSLSLIMFDKEKAITLTEAVRKQADVPPSSKPKTQSLDAQRIKEITRSLREGPVNTFTLDAHGYPVLQSIAPVAGVSGMPMMAVVTQFDARRLQVDFNEIRDVYQFACMVALALSLIFSIVFYDQRYKQHKANLRKKSTLEISILYQQTVQDLIQSFSTSSSTLYQSAMVLSKTSHAMQNETNTSSAMIEQFSQTIHSLTRANEQLAGQLARLLDNAITCNDIAKDTSNRVNKATQSFGNIGHTSDQTAQAIKLILEVSNRIDLLAVNAAIEAARAGDFGRGFSVVAGEVKSLSQQAKKAAETISNLLKHSEETVKESMDAVHSIRGSVHETNYMSEELSNLAKSQQMLQDSITTSLQLLTDQSERLKSSLMSVNSHVEDATYKSTEISTMSDRLRQNTQRLEVESTSFVSSLTEDAVSPPDVEKQDILEQKNFLADMPPVNPPKAQTHSDAGTINDYFVLEAVPINNDAQMMDASSATQQTLH